MCSTCSTQTKRSAIRYHERLLALDSLWVEILYELSSQLASKEGVQIVMLDFGVSIDIMS